MYLCSPWPNKIIVKFPEASFLILAVVGFCHSSYIKIQEVSSVRDSKIIHCKSSVPGVWGLRLQKEGRALRSLPPGASCLLSSPGFLLKALWFLQLYMWIISYHESYNCSVQKNWSMVGLFVLFFPSLHTKHKTSHWINIWALKYCHT